MSELIEFIKGCAAGHGLNLVGAIPAGRYDAAAPSHMRAAQIDSQARSIVVIGNGGGAFWRAYRRHLGAHPGWERRADPLDDFTREVVERDLAGALRERGVRTVTAYPFASAGHALHFQELGRMAGIGVPSIIGVLVHPVYGPWIAFRAALLLDKPIDEPADAVGFDPCPTCTARSCIPACPVGAVESAGWNATRCVRHRVEAEPDCAPQCHSRTACVLGPQYRYPDDELAYHQERALRSMREYYRSQWGEPPRR